MRVDVDFTSRTVSSHSLNTYSVQALASTFYPKPLISSSQASSEDRTAIALSFARGADTPGK